MSELTISSPAKINVCLSVLSRRPDGYHEVEMLMQMVGLYDEVRVALRGTRGISVTCDNSTVPVGEANIAYRAAEAIQSLSGSDAGLSIAITKRIPVAGGLGGGSGNAAAVLVACNKLLKTAFTRERLAEIGAGLGMDVPFFLHGPTALAQGRGERLTDLPPPDRFWVLLVNPGFEASTAWVYKNLTLGLTNRGDCNKIQRLTVSNAREVLHNDLEAVTSAEYPVIGRCKKALQSVNARGVLMSGSGPTVFGIFETEDSCRTAADTLSSEGWQLYPAVTLTESPLAQFIES